MQETKVIVTGDYVDRDTGLRFVEDIRGNFHFCSMMSGMGDINIEFNPSIEIPPSPSLPASLPSGDFTCTCNPEVIVTIDLAAEKDKEIYNLLKENAWLWGLIEQAIKDKKDKNCSYAMVKLEQAINGGMP